MYETKKGLIILDFNRTLYDPDIADMVPGSKEFLEKYSKDYILAIIGKGDEKRRKIIDDLGLINFLSYMTIVEEKTLEQFQCLIKQYPFPTSKIWSIGDRTKKEMKYSNLCNVNTIWLKSGKFAEELPSSKEETPNYTVTSFKEIEDIIQLN